MTLKNIISNSLSLFIRNKEITQIVLNLLAFLILFNSTGGNGSFWGFATFTILISMMLIEMMLSKDPTGLWLWLTKLGTYTFLTVKFSCNMGEIQIANVCMILISVVSLLVSRHLIKKRALGLWGQNVAFIIGSIMYITAILTNPDMFGIAHIVFWAVNGLSYLLLLIEIKQEKKDKQNYIVPGWGFTGSIIHVVVIILWWCLQLTWDSLKVNYRILQSCKRTSCEIFLLLTDHVFTKHRYIFLAHIVTFIRELNLLCCVYSGQV